MAEQVRSGNPVIDYGIPRVFLPERLPARESCVLCSERADFFASFRRGESEVQQALYCTDCFDKVSESAQNIIERVIPLTSDYSAGTEVSEQQLLMLLRGEPVVAGARRRVLTMADAPFIVVDRHLGPGSHPSGSPQEAHAGDGEAISEDQVQRVVGKMRTFEPIGESVPENASWFAPDGEAMAFGEDHGSTAVSALLEVEGVLHAEVTAVLRLVENYGFIRHTAFESEHGLMFPPRLSGEQKDQIVSVMDRFKAEGDSVEWYFERVEGGISENVDAGEIATELRLDPDFYDIGKWVIRHYGPGPHPSGSPQEVHAGDAAISGLPQPDDAVPSIRALLGDEQINDISEAIASYSDGPIEPEDMRGYREAWVSSDGKLYLVGELTHDEIARRAILAAISVTESQELATIVDNLTRPGRAEWFANGLGWLRMSGSKYHGFAMSFHAQSPPTEEQIFTAIQVYGKNDALDLFDFEAIVPVWRDDGDYEEYIAGKYVYQRGAEELYSYLDTVSPASARAFRALLVRHYGPGFHPGTGTAQEVHGGGSRADFARGHVRDVIEPLPKTDRWNVIRRSYDAIDSVHYTAYPPGMLPIPWRENRSKTRGGTFTYNRQGPQQISYNLRDDAGIDNHPMLNAVHEFGHFTDTLLGATHKQGEYGGVYKFEFASEAFTANSEHPYINEIEALGEAIRGSDGAQRLMRFNRRSWNDGFGNVTTLSQNSRNSLKTNVEFFARAYTQWIATRSGNSMLNAQLHSWRDGWRRGGGPDLQWDNDDFEPISEAMDNLFDAAGLLK